jgi:2-dehydro-3-deoxyphosphooctonate aldolase (KDO 8-P synthase)
MRTVLVRDIEIGEGQPLAVMSGPCVIESESDCMKAAETLKKMFAQHGVRLIVQNELDLPVVTDVHSPEEAKAVGEVCEIIQIPAFLCRQTDLILAAAATGAVVSVKKGQFLAPWDMKNVIDKITTLNNHNIILVDRGTSFGYNNLVTDMRGIPIMQKLGYPVCFDATHAVQKPGGLGHMSGGDREFIPTLAKAALAAGANCLFIESHPNPSQAKSDASSVLDFAELDRLLPHFKQLYDLIQKQNLEK